MPIFEYLCRKCGHRFEKIVRNDESPACASCQAADPEKLISPPGISTAKSRQFLQKEVKRSQQSQRRDQAYAHLEVERKHRHEHD